MKKILGLCDKNSRRAFKKPVGIFEQKTHPRWVKFFTHVLMVVLSVAVYLPCRELAVLERGNTAYGGEVLVPVMVFIVYVLFSDAFKEENPSTYQQFSSEGEENCLKVPLPLDKGGK